MTSLRRDFGLKGNVKRGASWVLRFVQCQYRPGSHVKYSGKAAVPSHTSQSTSLGEVEDYILFARPQKAEQKSFPDMPPT